MTPPPPSHLPFFVYGTLRSGQVNHVLVEGRTAPPIPAVLPGAQLYDGPGYPYAIRGTAGTDHEPGRETRDTGRGTDAVQGELLHILPDRYDSVLADLDRLEDHVPGARGNLYDRLALRVLCDGLWCDAWVYLAGEELARTLRASGRIIPGGDWVRARRAHRRS